ncbi:hypothetical protein JXB27_03560 [Candidatus Woesearchaeota archaeon]|nr:hypothetical protein [Candidatus Woesearchaeota archaeon]
MGLFGLGKKKKAKKEPKKEVKEEFELGSEGVKFVAIIELLGSPKKYVSDTLKSYVEAIKKNPDFYILSSKISTPKKAEKDEKDPQSKDIKTDLFAAFVELEVATKRKAKLFDFCFNYMPSSIEVVEPMNITYSANEMSKYLTDIQGTLHHVDFTLKQVNAANQILNQRNQNISRNMIQMLQNNIILSLKEKNNKSLDDLAKNTGVPPDQLKPFLDKMVAAGEIKLDKEKYSLVKK